MRRKRRAEPDAPVPQVFPTDIPGRPWWGLYSGDGINADGSSAPTFAGPEASMMILGPPRSGKTSTIVIPCVLDAPAAVVSTSTKPDVLAATIHARWQLGNCFVFDPSSTTTIPNGAVPLRWSPVTGCEEFEQATTMAHALAAASRPKASLTEGAHWVERAEALLAPLLFAAALRGRDMATVCRWILARDLREPEAVLEAQDHKMARAVLAGVTATEDRERSGIFSTASGLLAAYRSEGALASTTDPNFDPVAFVRSTDTVYICAPAHAQDQLAPLVVALLEQIRAAVYARPRNAAPVVFALDEVAGIAPLPSLPALAAEGGGQGLITLACLQDLSQARARWGDAAEGFFSLFNEKIVFPGIGDHRTLQLISALAGDEEVLVRSVNTPHWATSFLDKRSALPTTSTSVTWRPRLSVADVATGRPGCALLIEGSTMGWVAAVPWWNHPLWSTVIGANRPHHSSTGQLARPLSGVMQPPPTECRSTDPF
jgi:type IV secretion system protein VirD4